MSKGDVVGYTFLALCMALAVAFTSYLIAHEKGYMHGANQVTEYYEATHEFPSERWLEDFEATRFDNAEEILETLTPYN